VSARFVNFLLFLFLVLQEFYDFRLPFYNKRKSLLETTLSHDLKRLSNRARFILMVVSDELKLRNVPKKKVCEELWKHKFDFMNLPKKKSQKTKKRKTDEKDESLVEEDGEEQEDDGEDVEKMEFPKDVLPSLKQMISGYRYLTNMPLDSLTLEKVEELKKEQEDKTVEWNKIKNTSPNQMWIDDLDRFLIALNVFEEARKEELKMPMKKSTSTTKKRKAEDDKHPTPNKKKPSSLTSSVLTGQKKKPKPHIKEKK
jgi:DNA topoisomerase-2